MPCRDPLTGYRSKDRNPSGKRSIVFNPEQGYKGSNLKEVGVVNLPCGQCIFCRLERSRQWAIRCLHEAETHSESSWVTLTYDGKSLPPNGSLQVRDFQLFMKRLRKAHPEKKIRFYHCGEYGEKNSRPHYHACLFGIDFPDRRPWKVINEIQYYRSEKLETIWTAGNSMVGDVNFKSAGYVARYITKKYLGKGAADFYEVIDRETGEIHSLKPEYTTMSRRPGIAKAWYEKFKGDVYPDDFVVINGKRCRPPKFYDALLEKEEPQLAAILKAERKDDGTKNAHNCTHEKMIIREEIMESRARQLVRNYENGS